jgi:hypothetical protein
MRIFLNTQAVHQDDIGAASALRAYYGRVSIAEQFALLAESYAFLEDEEEKQAELSENGIASGADMSEFQRERLSLDDNRLQLEAQDRRLRALLTGLTCWDFENYLSQYEELDILAVPVDCAAVKQFAFANRMDLRAWQYLYCNVNEDTAPHYARMLPTLIGNWGLPLPPSVGLKYLLCPPDHSQLAANMKHELGLIVQTHRQWISQAIDEKCSNLRVAYQRVDLANQVIDSWESRLAQLVRLDQYGQSRPEQLAEARASLLQAEQQEIMRRMEARTAEIDLAEAVGGMRERCCARQRWLITGTPLLP